MIIHKYTYKPYIQNGRGMLFLFGIILFAIGLVYLSTMISMATDQTKFVSVTFWGNLANFLFFSIWSPMVLIFIAHLFSNVEIVEDGLRANFLAKTCKVSWDDILDVKAARLFGFKMKQPALLVVTKNSLTPFHRFYGLFYGNTNQPALLIFSTIDDYISLSNTISTQLKKKHTKKR